MLLDLRSMHYSILNDGNSLWTLPRNPLNERPQLDYIAFSQGFPDYKTSMLGFCAEEDSNNIIMNKITEVVTK